jgi:hypothetical protein
MIRPVVRKFHGPHVVVTHVAYCCTRELIFVEKKRTKDRSRGPARGRTLGVLNRTSVALTKRPFGGYLEPFHFDS